ncbi:MAG: protein kinase domain-containing protein [Chloroflexota bacterium]
MIDRVLNGRYQLTALLGEGGMAVVYEAQDLLLGRKVAIKVLREQFASDAAFLARFQREARAAASLSHPNIVAVYDVGSEAGTQYIVMELVAGRTLREMVEGDAPLGAARIIELGRQICEGLEYAHQQGIVHRDVKPHNILVTRDGRAKIADFGIAVALGASSLTQSGYVVGSAQYISPEQAMGEPSTAFSDLYSTGVTLYEMATGRLPFEGETSVVVALKQIQEEPVPPRRLNPRIPESLQSVILQAMAKNPTERYGSGSEMAEALMACARVGMEATQPQQVVAPKGPAAGRSAPPRTAAPGPVTAPRTRRQGPGGWMVLLVVFAAFLCTLGSIPLGILAYSNGTLGRWIPALASPTTDLPGTSTAPTAEPTQAPSPVPTATTSPLRAPNLVGVPLPTAQQMAQSNGLDVVIAEVAYDSRHPATYVIRQRPEPDTPVEKGARIEVVVSQGKEMGTVPRVVESTLTVAQEKLRAAGFRWRVSEETSDQTPAGVVMSQTPAPDVSAEKGTEVLLRVSAGREKVRVPNLVGRTEAEAQDAIVKAGLAKTWVNYQDYTFVPPGHVLSQEPKADTMVEKGTTVYIAVRRPGASSPSQPPQKQ